MNIKIGKKIFIILLNFVFFASVFGQDLVEIEILDKYKRSINQVVVNEPFWVNLRITGNISGRLPDIPGLEKLVLLSSGQSQYISISSGQNIRQIIFNYLVRADSPGEYIIGPVDLNINNKKYSAIAKTILVNSGVNNSQMQQVNNIKNKKYLFAKLNINKNKIFVGEEIRLKLRVYYSSEQQIELKNISPVQLDGFNFVSWKLESQGQENLDGNIYNVFEFCGILEPNKPGEFYLEPVKITYSRVDNLHSLNIFSQIIGGLTRSEVIDVLPESGSNIFVEQLPDFNNRKINIIGEYYDFNISVDKNKAYKSEGIIFQAKITGNGNLDKINKIKLNLPDNIKYYESKKTVLKELNKNIYIFEYIIQANILGDFIIEPQEFVFFDLQDKSYKTLKSNNLVINIVTPNISVDNSVDNIVLKNIKNNNNINFINLILLVLLILSLIFLIFNKKYFFKKSAFDQASYKLKLARINNNLDLVFIFTEFFSNKLRVSEKNISLEYTCEILKERKMGIHEIEQWKDFFTELLNIKFGNKSKISLDQDRLYCQAINWLSRLEDVIKA